MEKEFFKYLFSLDLISKEYDQEFIFSHLMDYVKLKDRFNINYPLSSIFLFATFPPIIILAQHLTINFCRFSSFVPRSYVVAFHC